MEGMKFDTGKARWDLVPAEYLTKMSQAIRPFIEMHLIREDKLVFNKDYLYNIARANIFRWKDFGAAGMIGRLHPLMTALIALLMLAKRREYSIEDVFSEFSFDQRWDLIETEWTTNLAEIYAYGAITYEDDNWMQVESKRYYAAANRHIDAYHAGKLFDEESGFLHLYHAAWNCIALMWLESHSDNKIVSEIPPAIIRAAKKLQGISHINVAKKAVKKKKN